MNRIMSAIRKVIDGKLFLLEGFAETAKERDAAKKRLKLKFKYVRVVPPQFKGDSYRLYARGKIPKKTEWCVTTKDGCWAIVDVCSGRSKKFGKSSGRGINYHDRAVEEAQRRNKDGKHPRRVYGRE